MKFFMLTLFALVAYIASFGTPTIYAPKTTFCKHVTDTMIGTPSGGTWTSSATSVATVGSSNGYIFAVAGGTATITYNVSGSYATVTVSVNPSYLPEITGPAYACPGSTVVLSDSLAGGYWTSGRPSTVTVSPAGVVSGLTTGLVMIDYTYPGTCFYASVGFTIDFRGLTPAVDPIYGSAISYVGMTNKLTDGTLSGTWTSGNTAVAIIDPVTGVVTGIAPGSATISYTVAGCSTATTVTYPIVVYTTNPISGTVYFPGGVSVTPGMIWLITYNPVTFNLDAIDSISFATSGGATSFHYQFLGAPTDSYRIKAAVICTMCTSYGYIPTYHNSSYYWYAANVLYHNSSTADTGQDITMMMGTPTYGSGFIRGNVLLGANKGTSGAAAVGLRMYLLNSAGALLQSTMTDASGNYTFSDLPAGTYSVFPESLNYMTTPYSSITITSTSSMSAANFVQHTKSHTITPVMEGVINNTVTSPSISILPNPSNGNINIRYTVTANETGSITISDMAGRRINNSTINMNQGTGSSELNLAYLPDGLYMINVRSESINVNDKIQIRH